ncbi:hypothetical protein PTI98_002016 [Pleurotus ostreatus]|nr:hypothetical protein PTI98_002016 [Pleurotus ostreatus]
MRIRDLASPPTWVTGNPPSLGHGTLTLGTQAFSLPLEPRHSTQSLQPHEQIIASAIYYYQADPEIKDQGLSFQRRKDNNSDFPSNKLYAHHICLLGLALITGNHIDNGTKVGDGEEEEDDEDKEDEDKEDEDKDADGPEPEHNYPSDWEYTEHNGAQQPHSTLDLPIFTRLGTVPATGAHGLLSVRPDVVHVFLNRFKAVIIHDYVTIG